MAVLVDLEQVASRRVGRVLFEGLSLTVSDGDRIGVVGINGTGKSTLLRIVAGAGEHQGTDLYGADSAFEIKFCGERDAGKLIRRNVREEGPGVKVDGVAAGGLNDGHTLARDVIAEIGRRSDAVTEVVFFEGFLHADRDGFEISSGEAAVGRIALGEDEEIFFLLGQ